MSRIASSRVDAAPWGMGHKINRDNGGDVFLAVQLFRHQQVIENAIE